MRKWFGFFCSSIWKFQLPMHSSQVKKSLWTSGDPFINIAQEMFQGWWQIIVYTMSYKIGVCPFSEDFIERNKIMNKAAVPLLLS